MSDIESGYVPGGTVAIRADAEGDGRTISGYAYRWGTLTGPGATKEYGMARQGFERGAFLPAIAARAGRPWPHLDRHGRNVVGSIQFSEDDIGLRYDGRLLDTPAARDYAATIPAGNDGVSLEFIWRTATAVRRGDAVMLTKVQHIAALAGEYAPAYDGATVALRSDGGSEVMAEPIIEPAPTPAPEPVAARADAGVVQVSPEVMRAIATDVATEVYRGLAERGSLGPTAVSPYAGYATIGELAAAAYRDTALRGYAADAIAHRVLDDTTFNSGANAALANGNLVTTDIKRLVNRGRPAITAFGGPRPLGDTAGLTLNWPYFDGTLADFVAAQSAEKAEIISASVDVKLATEALLTYAGGSDISYQVIRRGDPSILDAYARIWLAAWAAVTDAAFVTELETGSATQDFAEALSAHDLAEFTTDFVTASIAVEAATGQPAQFVLASTTAFSRLAVLIAPSNTDIAAASSMDLRGLRIAVGNLPIIHVPGVTAGKVIISNELAAAWYEDGPFQATAEDVEKLGRNVAYWSLGAGARFVPAGIIEAYDVTP